MFIEERHEKIMELVRRNGRVEVRELGELFGVSEDSARRDLRILEKQGLLERTYGGAILPKSAGFPAFPAEGQAAAENGGRADLASLAASFVRDGDTVFLDGAPAVERMIPELVRKNRLTVFTHSVEIAHAVLFAEPKIELYLIGGRVNRDSASALGADTCETIGRLHADRVFTAPRGISAKWGLSCSSAEEAPVKRAMLEAGGEVFVLAPADALGRRALVCYAPVRAEYAILAEPAGREPSAGRGTLAGRGSGDELSALAAAGAKLISV